MYDRKSKGGYAFAFGYFLFVSGGFYPTWFANLHDTNLPVLYSNSRTRALEFGKRMINSSEGLSLQ